MSGDLLVEGGTVVSGHGSFRADVLVLDGRIAEIGDVEARAGVMRLDAGGCLVLPGGVDVHTHVFGRIEDDTRSALHGGTTSLLSFILHEPGEHPAETARRAIADEIPRSAIDLGIHGVIWEPEAYRSGDLRRLTDLGVTSVKLWLAYRELGIMADDTQIFAVMREAAAEGVTVQAHCENGCLVDALRDEFVAGGRTALRYHAAARPVELEEEAVHRFLAVARLAGADAYVVHVSSAAAVDQVERARGAGQTVFAEACSHHLAFDESVYERPDASRYVMTPPLRSEGDRRAIWNSLAQGRINVYASDHGHLTLAKKLAAGEDFTGIEPGVPGVEARLAVGFTFGVDAGLISKERLIAAACTEPARIFGLYPRKGAVVPGADGDLVVWDTRVRRRFGTDALHDGLDYTPYEGVEAHGAPRAVVVAGEVAIDQGREVERRGSPRYLGRGRYTVAA